MADTKSIGHRSQQKFTAAAVEMLPVSGRGEVGGVGEPWGDWRKRTACHPERPLRLSSRNGSRPAVS